MAVHWVVEIRTMWEPEGMWGAAFCFWVSLFVFRDEGGWNSREYGGRGGGRGGGRSNGPGRESTGP